MEIKLYGEDSTKLAKTYKIIGTLHIILENKTKAREYVNRAYKIFEAKGNGKMSIEISEKLKIPNPDMNAADNEEH